MGQNARGERARGGGDALRISARLRSMTHAASSQLYFMKLSDLPVEKICIDEREQVALAGWHARHARGETGDAL